jgi:hypothetical protein
MIVASRVSRTLFFGKRSFAASLFVLFGGMMIPMTATEPSHPLSYYFQREALVIVLAILIIGLVALVRLEDTTLGRTQSDRRGVRSVGLGLALEA